MLSVRRWVLAAAAVVILAMPAGLTAQEDEGDPGVQVLLDGANDSRGQAGVAPLSIDPALARAAQRHAELMAERNEMSHQLDGEPDVLARVSAAGAHFSALAENVAVSDALHRIHDSWMKSTGHRTNLLNPAYNVIGIGIAHRGGRVYAVEDFATQVRVRPAAEIEQRVRDMLAVRGLTPLIDTTTARRTCAAPGPYSGPEPVPSLIVRFASSEFEPLGPVLDSKLAGQQGHSVAVGSCADTGGQGFTRYKIAILVY